MTEQKIMDFARAEFEWLHAHPELAYEEFETTARLRTAFVRAGIRILNLPLKTGLIAVIGTGEKPIVALRTARTRGDRAAVRLAECRENARLRA